MIEFSCPKCQAILRAPEEKIGAHSKCGSCGCPVQVPALDEPPVAQAANVQTLGPEETYAAREMRLVLGFVCLVWILHLGGWGVHKFILGRPISGILMLSISLVGEVLAFCTIGISLMLPAAISLIAIVEGIIYLTTSDEDFYRSYIVGKRSWF